jgi:hypothetical protein
MLRYLLLPVTCSLKSHPQPGWLFFVILKFITELSNPATIVHILSAPEDEHKFSLQTAVAGCTLTSEYVLFTL